MESMENVVLLCTCLCFLACSSNVCDCAGVPNNITTVPGATSTARHNRTITATVSENDSDSFLSIPERESDTNIAASDYVSKSMYFVPGLVVPGELSSRVNSSDELVALLNSPKLLANLSVPETVSLVSVLTSAPGLLTAVPPSAVVNVISAVSASPRLFRQLPRPVLYSLLTVFTVRPRLFDSLSTTVAAQFAAGLFSLSPAALYDVPTPILVNSLGAACSPTVLGSLSAAQLANLVTLLSLSPSLVRGLPVAGLVSLARFLSAGAGADALARLPSSTLFGLLRGLFDAMADSSEYLLNGSTVPAVVALLGTLLTPGLLNVAPPDAFHSLLAVLYSSPGLLAGLRPSNVASLLWAVASSPKLLVSVNASHLTGVLNTIASRPGTLDVVLRHAVVSLINAMFAYTPRSVYSIPKSTLTKLVD